MSSISSTDSEVDDCIERHADATKKRMHVEDIFANNPIFEKKYAEWAEPIITEVLRQCEMMKRHD